MLSQRSIGAAGTGLVLPSDDEFNTVSFLSHFDGTNNGKNNVFDDSSSSNHTITANGNVTQGSFGPFARPDGEWGVDFKNTSALVLPASSTDFDFGTADFTIECYMQYLGGSSDDSYIISFGGGSGNAGHFGINIYQGNWRVGAFNNDLAAGTAPTDGDWHHIAVVYVSNVFKLYVDGSIVSSSGSSGPFNTTTGAVIGGYWANSVSNNWNGLLSNLRIVKGTAVYTSNFTPPTGPLTAISGTVLLTCQSNRFVDNSASAHTITPAGNPAVSAFGPFLTDAAYDPAVNGASAYLQDSGYLSFAESSDFDVGTGDFTIECSLYYAEAVPSGTNYDYIWGFGTNTNTGFGLYIQGGVVGIWNNSYVATGSTTVKQGEWTTLAVVRSGSTLSIYQNGVRETTATFSSDITTAGNGGSIGGWIDVNSINIPTAYITDFRFVNGTALRSGASYTVPTAPLTAVTNTKLLLNMADGQAIDSAAQNNLTLYGDAKISSTQSKFGGTSLALDGTGDYAIAANNPSFNFGTGDFTVEMFVYATAIGGGSENVILDTRAVNADAGLVIYSANNAVLSVTSSAAVRATAGTISTNQWIHVAVVRSSGILTAYINGIGGTGASYSSAITSPGPFRIGVHENGGSTWQGFIDEYRVSNTARYTANFTPPTEPFADKGE